jgi:LPXTG-motif cell wall-anchored protein
VTATTAPDTPVNGQATTTVPPGSVTGNLPFTGGDMGFPIVFGLSLLGAGGLLVVRKRRAWSR